MAPPQETPQQNLYETLQEAADSVAAADSALAAADTAGGTASWISEQAQEAGRALQRGDIEGFWNIFIANLAESAASFVPKLISALLILLLLYGVYRFVESVLSQILTRNRRVDAGLQGLLMKTYRVATLAFIAVMVLGELGFNVTALLAGLSIAGIAVGFAARDTLENFISGVTILTDRPFNVGDKIEMEDVYGTVEEITLRSTRIRTQNNVMMVLPNVDMIKKRLLNHSMFGTVRVEIPFGIAYKEYPSEAREVVMALTEGDDRLHPNYPPSIVVTELNDSSVDMVLRLYLRDPDLEVPIRFEYVEKIREALRHADIEIPFPHRQLFLDEAKALDESFLTRPHLSLQRPTNGDAEKRGVGERGNAGTGESEGRGAGEAENGGKGKREHEEQKKR